MIKSWWRSHQLEFFLAVLSMLVLVLYCFVAIKKLTSLQPFDVVEGFSIQQANLVPNWPALYPSSTTNPALLTAYPPFFYSINHLLFGEINTFAYGRMVSLVSLIGIFLAIFYLGKKTKERYLFYLILFFSSPLLIYWSLMNRVDLLAIALSLVSLAVFSRKNKFGLVASAVFMSLAMLTKQSLGWPALAYVLFELASKKKWRELFVFLMIWILALSGSFLYLNHVSHGGFIYNLVTVNFSMGWHWSLFSFFVSEFILRFSPLIYVVVSLALSERKVFTNFKPIWVYFLAALITLLATFKSGSNSNYLLEPTIGLMWLGGELSLKYWTNSKKILILCLLILISFALRFYVGEEKYLSVKNQSIEYEQLTKIVTQTKSVLADELALAYLPIAKQKIILDPFATRELIASKMMDEQFLEQMIKQKKVDMVIITDKRGGCCSRSGTWHELGNANYWLYWPAGFYKEVYENYFYLGRIGEWLVFSSRPSHAMMAL